MLTPTAKNLILTVYLPNLTVSFCKGLLLPVLPLYARSFEVSYGLIGLVLAAEGIGTLLSDVPAGMLLRRLGQRKVMILGMICTVLGVLGLVWARSLAELIACRLVSGMGLALWDISRYAYLAEVVHRGLRGRAIAVWGGIARMGKFFGPALGGVVAAAYGFRAPFLIYAVLAAVMLAVVAVWVRGRGSGIEATRSADKGGGLMATLKSHRRELVTAGSGQIFAQMIRAAFPIVVPLYAADALGLQVQDVGLILSISAALDMCMFYPAGMLMDRFGRKYASVPCFLIQAVGMALIPLSDSFMGLLGAATLIGLGNGIGSGTMMTLGADLAPPQARGEFLGMWRFVGDGGLAASPLIVGSVADLVGLALAPLAVSGMGLAAAFILAVLVPETLRKPEPG